MSYRPGIAVRLAFHTGLGFPKKRKPPPVRKREEAIPKTDFNFDLYTCEVDGS